jgi:hypothetical protein
LLVCAILFHFYVFCVFVGHGRKESVYGNVSSLKGKLGRPEDLVKFNQIKEMIKSEFIKLKSKPDWIQIWIMHMSRYFDHNFQLKYYIKVILAALEIKLKIIQITVK